VIMSETGTAIYFLGVDQPLEAREYPLPKKLEPRAMLVRTSIATVCGSDMYSWRGRRPFPTPSVLGHEGVGLIERMGSEVDRDTAGERLAVGDRITWTIMANCGQCVFCRVYGLPQKCQKLFKYGHSVSDVPPYFLGTFGEFVYIMPGTSVYKLPEQMSDEVASPLMCAAATVAGGLDRAGIRPGDNVVVQGAGMLGLYASVFAKALGAGQVIMIDVLDQRLQTAARFGADHLINAAQVDPQDLRDAVRERTNGLGADLAIEVAGRASVIETGVALLRTGGRYLIQGAVYPGDPLSVDSHDIVTKCLTVYGLHNYEPKHLWMALNLVLNTQETYPFSELTGPRFELTAEGVESAMLALEQRKGIRPIVSHQSR
jgi:putative phosphonate catabolism associated alcohol dehydrogenase